MKVGDLVEVITRPIGHIYLRKYINTKHKIISIKEGKIYLGNISNFDLRNNERLYYWEKELRLLKEDELQISKECDNKQEQPQMELLQKFYPVCSTIINGLLEVDLQNNIITLSGIDILEALQEYENCCVRLTIEKI